MTHPTSRARVFWSGRSQAVRLPKAFRFDGDEVSIRREGRSVVIEPIEHGWEWLDRLPAVSSDFFEGGRDQPALDDEGAVASFDG